MARAGVGLRRRSCHWLSSPALPGPARPTSSRTARGSSTTRTCRRIPDTASSVATRSPTGASRRRPRAAGRCRAGLAPSPTSSAPPPSATGWTRGWSRPIVQTESAGNPTAVSPKGARGLMQLMPERAAELGVRDSFDPTQNVDGGVRHMRDLLQRFRGDVTLALAAYNAGEAAVRNHGGVPPYAETREYVRRVRALYSGAGQVDVRRRSPSSRRPSASTARSPRTARSPSRTCPRAPARPLPALLALPPATALRRSAAMSSPSLGLLDHRRDPARPPAPRSVLPARLTSFASPATASRLRSRQILGALASRHGSGTTWWREAARHDLDLPDFSPSPTIQPRDGERPARAGHEGPIPAPTRPARSGFSRRSTSSSARARSGSPRARQARTSPSLATDASGLWRAMSSK